MKKSLFAILVAVIAFASCEKQEFQDLKVESIEKNESHSNTLKSSASIVTLHNAKLETDNSLHYKAVGYIKVKNIDYNKQVSIRYTSNGGGSWQDIDAEYFASIEDGCEIWRFSSQSIAWSRYNLPSFKFAIRYRVSGQEYWDSNSGNDYHLNIQLGSLYQDFLLGPETMVLSSSLSIAPANDYFTKVEFIGHVRNIDYNKQVLVVFTTDDWASKHIVEAVYSSDGQPIQPGIETWKVTSTIPVSSNNSRIKAYIEYNVAGQTFWDNNYTFNYVFE